jgi:hypothetical protein
MPWRTSRMPKSSMPNSSQFLVRVSTWSLEISSAICCDRSLVGTLWSGTASVASGRRTLRPVMRRPSKACGLVTSCTRCRST